VNAGAQRAAAGYMRSGAAVIPIPAGSKSPGRDDWQSLRITKDDISNYWTNGQGIGLLTGEPSGWLVDVDLDVQEAVKIAERFLPQTLTSGRESRPHSHWWFRALGTTNHDFKDTDGKKRLVELRSTGRQTLVAPSSHPSGEQYRWHRESGSDVAEIPADELAARVRELSTATLIARHLPQIRDERSGEGGGRHDYALALSGFLLRPGRLESALVEKILKAAWDAKGWPGEREKREAHSDLEGIVRDTVENLAEGEPVVGGPTLDEMEPGMVRQLRKYWGWHREEKEDQHVEKEERRNQADRLIGYALEDAQVLFVDQHSAPHALIAGEPVPLTSRCYSWLRRLMWEREERAVNGEYLKTAAGTLAAHAEFSGEVRELHTRAAWCEGTLYYELGPGRVVRAGAGGWGVEPNPPVLFRRFPNLKPLPDPRPGGDAKDLAAYANLKTNRDRRLFTAYGTTLALPHLGRPIFNASGAMGSGKTTIQRLIKRLLDPTAPETVRFDPRDFLQKASHAYIVMLDNQNTIPEWAADTLCRLVTGEADSKRRLYTDDEDVIIELRRAVLLNGINVPTERGDVLDRSLVVELERIPDGERRTEEELWELFEEEHPRLLGALFGVLAEAIALKPSLKLSRRPRLADWGEYAASVYEVMGWGAEQFLEDWDEVVKVQNQATLDGSPVAQAVIKFMEGKNEYAASSSEMHSKLKAAAAQLGVDVERDKAWPKSARWLWRRIKEVLPLLVAAGIEATYERPETGTRIALRKMPKSNASNARMGESRSDKENSAGNKQGSNASPNASSGPNASANASPNAANQAGSGNTGNTGNRNGDFSERLSTFLREPPPWYIRQAEECARQGSPERLLKPLASAVAYHVLGNTHRWSEVLPHVEAALKERGGR
jgi:Bifunctional DNA primase/polymerase, N-terminal